MAIDRPVGLDLIDFAALAAWMDDERLGGGAICDIMPLTGGSQNVIVRFARGGTDYVLRRPPAHPGADGNATMRREARILRALAGTDVPHPRLIGACADESVLGAAFYRAGRYEDAVRSRSTASIPASDCRRCMRAPPPSAMRWALQWWTPSRRSVRSIIVHSGWTILAIPRVS